MATGSKAERETASREPTVGCPQLPETSVFGTEASYRDIWSQSATRSKCVYARSKTRQLPRYSVLVEHALGYRSVQFRLGELKGVSGSRLVTARDCRLAFFDESPHSADAGPIHRRALDNLAYALFCRSVTGHARSR